MSSFSFVGLRKVWYIFSLVLIGVSFAMLAMFGLRYSIDFTGGSLLELTFPSGAPTSGDLTTLLANAGYESVSVQSGENNKMIVRLETLAEEEHQALLSAVRTSANDVEELRFDSIGPSIGRELRTSSLLGVVMTLTLIGLYIAWAFRKVSEPVASWKYGILTVVTAAHDIIIPLGVFAVLGQFYHWEVGSAFVAAILTILGYSISDTVVVFDRTRENLGRRAGESFEVVVEKSIRQTYVRSINTSATSLLALLAIFAWGGETTRPFALALIIGIATGTYSSIFIASPLLVTWEKRFPRR